MVALFLSAGLATVARATGEGFSAATNKTGYANTQIAISDLAVNGTGDDVISLNLFVPKGALSFSGATTGVAFSGPASGANIQMQGKRSDINAALGSLQYYNFTSETATVTARLGGGDGSVYFSGNHHVYQVVTPASPMTWAQAKAAAEASTYGGVNGYLATITNQAENDFILARINQSGWIGATDLSVEGEWRWATGPEANTQFWQGIGAANGGYAVGGQFSYWNTGEPNDFAGAEDCAQISFLPGSNGRWNDTGCGSTAAKYVVEYGAPNALPTVASTTFDITTTPAPKPKLVSVTPSNNQLDVLLHPTLTLKFDMPVNLCEGECALSLMRSSDDTAVASWYPGVAGFQGNNTDTFTLTLPTGTNLNPATSYYLVGGSGIISVAYGSAFDGLATSTDWVFTTGDGDAISAAVEDAAPNNGDGNNDGIKDSLQANVTSFVSPVTNNYVTLELDSACKNTSTLAAPESANAVQDADYNYATGMIAFTADCGASGFTTPVKIFNYGVDSSNLSVRKYHDGNKTYAAISGAALTQQTIGGKTTAVATYSVTDGGALDTDGTANGVIKDPVGLAMKVAVPSAPDSGKSALPIVTAIVILASLLALGFLVTRKLNHKTN